MEILSKKTFTKLEIVNAALVECGLAKISDFGVETTKTSLNSEFLFDLSYQTLLEKPYNWDFATKEVYLDLLTNETPKDSRWKAVYKLPSDYVRFVSSNHDIIERRSTGIFSDDATTQFRLTYVGFVQPSALPATFINALVFFLAARFAFTFKKDKNLKLILLEQAEDALGDAFFLSSQSSRPINIYGNSLGEYEQTEL